MFKLLYQSWVARQGFVAREKHFTGGEHRTVVEMAREMVAQPDKYQDVKVLDLRLGKTEVVTILPTQINDDCRPNRLVPEVVSRVTLSVPALEFLDLGKLPRKKATAKPKKTVKLLGLAVAGLESLDLKPKRTSKRDRQYVSVS